MQVSSRRQNRVTRVKKRPFNLQDGEKNAEQLETINVTPHWGRQDVRSNRDLSSMVGRLPLVYNDEYSAQYQTKLIMGVRRKASSKTLVK